MFAVICRVNRAFAEMDRLHVTGIAEGLVALVACDHDDDAGDESALADALNAMRRDGCCSAAVSSERGRGVNREPGYELLIVRASPMSARQLGAADRRRIAPRHDAGATLHRLAQFCGPGTHVADVDCPSPVEIELRMCSPSVTVFDTRRRACNEPFNMKGGVPARTEADGGPRRANAAASRRLARAPALQDLC